MLILIAVVDITIGISALIMGIMAFVHLILPLSLMAYVVMNCTCLALAVGSLFAIQRKNVRVLRLYYAWKCLEVVIIPIFELIILTVSAKYP
jgi:hypothetical protein